ncbi:ferredoxin reductase family protein [Diaphorobacter caeni]|uniref:ferredoxin reductase family protein n=1 Tax=Diaphorobacter caeni TaxID=2784387 RepID=UPI00188E96AB|nr:ferric reductase-like transmembrane domain-containing protein [Diaphorobacter caeni]MBF5003541.1 ferric reductase-like transmembrane domain-containing protein [Diaphorobacter caeni]
MRRFHIEKHWVLGAFLAVITALWVAVSPPGWRIFPLVDADGAASGAWALRQHALYLSGLLSVGLMSLCMLLALRQPWMERVVGGMDQVYRLHKWAGIGAGGTAIAHWLAKESGGWIKEVWGSAGRPAREAMLAWAGALRSPAKDIGEIAFYILLGLLLVTLCQQLLNYRRWRWTHRAMPLIYLALVCHSVVLMPARFWLGPLGVWVALMFTVGGVAACVSLMGRIGRSRIVDARIERVTMADGDDGRQPFELVCAMPRDWRGFRPGQFAFLSFDRAEGAHPFTIASAPMALGLSARGEPLLRFVIKPLGDCTSALAALLRVGQCVQIEGPYGRFDAKGKVGRDQVWIAGGVGITPFLAFLEARQPMPDGTSRVPDAGDVQMHYCTRDAARDALLMRLRQLCEQAVPAVHLSVHDAAAGDFFVPELLAQQGARGIDIWFCGPAALGTVLKDACGRIGAGRWRLHRELFVMR